MLQYQVEWGGYDGECTWEPAAHLESDTVLQKYLKAKKKKAKHAKQPQPTAAAAIVSNAAADAAAAHSTSVDQGVRAQSVAEPHNSIAHGWWATLEPDESSSWSAAR